MRAILISLLAVSLAIPTAFADAFDHGAWDRLLERHVTPLPGGHATVVDYDGLARDRAELERYLDDLSGVGRDEFDTWSRSAQLAFLINAYNAWTVELILTAWPDVESIKDLGSFLRSPWSKPFVPLLGQTRSLDEIEHDMIRGSGRYDEPRIHFAVNCASVGCPALRTEAYSADRLAEQLHDQTRLFLSDRSRNRLEGGKLRLSSIFRWYRDDFERGWMGYASLTGFLIDHSAALALSAADIEALEHGEMKIAYLPYDWGLNARR